MNRSVKFLVFLCLSTTAFGQYLKPVQSVNVKGGRVISLAFLDDGKKFMFVSEHGGHPGVRSVSGGKIKRYSTIRVKTNGGEYSPRFVTQKGNTIIGQGGASSIVIDYDKGKVAVTPIKHTGYKNIRPNHVFVSAHIDDNNRVFSFSDSGEMVIISADRKTQKKFSLSNKAGTLITKGEGENIAAAIYWPKNNSFLVVTKINEKNFRYFIYDYEQVLKAKGKTLKARFSSKSYDANYDNYYPGDESYPAEIKLTPKGNVLYGLNFFDQRDRPVHISFITFSSESWSGKKYYVHQVNDDFETSYYALGMVPRNDYFFAIFSGGVLTPQDYPEFKDIKKVGEVDPYAGFGESNPVSHYAYDSNKKRLALLTFAGDLHIYELYGKYLKKKTQKLSVPKDTNSLVFSKDGKYLISGSHLGQIRIFESLD